MSLIRYEPLRPKLYHAKRRGRNNDSGGADACKKAAMKYIAASEKQEDEAKAAAMAEAMEDVLSEKSNESCKDSAV